MTLLQNPPSLPGNTVAAASARGATKTYGTGDTEVLALDGVDIDFAAGQFTAIMGPSGSGKSTLMHCMAGLDRLTRRLGHHRRRRHHDRQREAAHPAAARPSGLHLPGVQPRADADRDREHHTPDGPRRHEARPGLGRQCDRDGRVVPPPEAPAQRTVGRPATARRRRPRVGQPATDHLRRRAHGQPRQHHGSRRSSRSCAMPYASSARRSSW